MSLDTYTQLGDMRDSQFEKIWNNPGTTFLWKSSVEKRGKSGVRQNMYIKCTTPKEMRELYQQQVKNKCVAFKNVNAKEEFKWDFKRGNVSVNVPKICQSPFFVRTKVTKMVEPSTTTVNTDNITILRAEEDAGEESEFDNIVHQSQAYLSSPMKSKSHPILKTPTKTIQNPKKKKASKTSSKTSQSTQPWDEIFSPQSSQMEETLSPPLSPPVVEESTTLSQSPPAPRTPIPFHIRQKLESQDQPVIKSVPLSYNSSWLKRSSNSPSFSQSPSKRPWYSTFQE